MNTHTHTRETALEMTLSERARRLKEFPPAQHLSLLDFVRVAEAIRLQGHGRGWEVFLGGRSLGFADGTHAQALLQAHRREVNNALYANDTGAFEWIWMELPTAAVLNRYPDLRELFPLASKKLDGHVYFEVEPVARIDGQARYVRMEPAKLDDAFSRACAAGRHRAIDVLLEDRVRDLASVQLDGVRLDALTRVQDEARCEELARLWAWATRPQGVRQSQSEPVRERQAV